MKDNKNIKEITVKIEGEKWENALDKAFEKLNQKAKIDGFRPGKAPKSVFLKHYGIESLYNEAAESAMEDAYQKMLEEAKDLEFAARPSLDIKNIDEKHIEYVFYITTKPEVKLGKYKELGIKPKKVTVTKEEIEHSIEHMREHYKENIVKEGAIKEGDIAVIDYAGFDGDKAFEGGTAENYPLEIGSHTFIPGFEEQLIGLKAGDEKDVNVTFPEDYHAEELKGAPVVFKVKVNEIKTIELPELDKDFFADLGMDDVSTVEELRKQVKETIKARKETDAENKYIDDVLEAASKTCEVDVPKVMVNEESHRMVHQYEEHLQMQGLTLEQYFEFTKGNLETLKKNIEPQAVVRIKTRYLLEGVVEKENLTVTDDEVKAEVKRLAEMYGTTEEEITTHIGDSEVIGYDLKMRKALDFLKEN